MDKNSCYHWWGTRHDFDKWEFMEQYDLVQSLDGSVKGKTIFQINNIIKRKCKDCGYIEINIQTESI